MLAIRKGSSRVRRVRVSKFANPSTNVYRPFPGTNTPTATLGRLFCFTIFSISRSRLRATAGAKRSFERVAAGKDAVECQRLTAHRSPRRIGGILIESLQSVAPRLAPRSSLSEGNHKHRAIFSPNASARAEAEKFPDRRLNNKRGLSPFHSGKQGLSPFLLTCPLFAGSGKS